MRSLRTWADVAAVTTWTIVAWCAALRIAQAAQIDAAQRANILQAAAAREDRFWARISTAEPYPSLGSRSLFAAALASGEARVHPERLDRFFELAAHRPPR